MRVLIFFYIFLTPAITIAQASDFITVRKKNNRTVKSYFPGAPIACQTVFGHYFNGIVEAVRNDSVFIRQYDVLSIPTMWGVSKIDTLTSYLNGIHYKDIRVLELQQRKSFGFFRSGTIFIIGGLGYAGLNIINGGYLNESVAGKENRKKLGIALGVAGAGFIMKYLHNRSNRFERKYKVEYIRMTVPKRRGA